MNSREQVLRRDRERRDAMVAADVNALRDLLADDLTWTHSSGTTESKAEFTAAIEAQTVVYEELEVEQDHVRGTENVSIHSGILKGRASRNGQTKSLHAKFLAVWQVLDGQLQLVAWQSTNCSM